MLRKVNYQRPNSAPSVSIVDHLAATFKYNTRDQWTDIVQKKHWVYLNGTICTDPDTPLPPRAVIGFDVPAEMEPEVDERMQLLYCDSDIVVVSKSGNMPVGVGGRYSKRTLVNVAPRRIDFEKKELVLSSCSSSSSDEKKNPLPSLLAVHRLDKETSGIVVMARNATAAAGLGRQFARCADNTEEEAAAEGANASSGEVEVVPQRRDRTIDKDVDEDDKKQNKEGDVDDDDAATSTSSSVVLKEYFAVLIGHLDRELDIKLRIGAEHELPAATTKTNNNLPNRKLKKLRVACAPEDQTSFGRSARTVVTPVAWSRTTYSKCSSSACASAISSSSSSSTKITQDISTTDNEQNKAAAKSSCRLTACRVRLYTGRTHQIRLHCAAAGFPLVGDKLYAAGGGTVDCDTYLKRTRGECPVVQQVGLESAAAAAADSGGDDGDGTKTIVASRHLLHARLLKFVHPTSGKPMQFESDPWPLFAEACPVLKELFSPCC